MAPCAKEISSQDVRATEKNRIQYSSKHVKHLPPGTVTDFEWKDYCPTGFRLIQQLEDIDHDEYTHSICNDETLRKLSSGKVGKMFLLSEDDRFLIKILRKSEIKVILEMLPNYYHHVQKYRSTLLSKIYGAHFVKPVGGVKTYFVVMSNVLQSDVFMSKVYDLKGSPLGRTSKKIKVREKTILKDIDLDFCFYVDPLTRRRLIKQAKLDCELLEAEGIMDYSLMLGVQVKGSCPGSLDELSPVYDSSSPRESLDSFSSLFMKTASNSPDRSSTMYSCTPSRDSMDSESSISIKSMASINSTPVVIECADSPQMKKPPKSTLSEAFFNSGSSTNFGMKIGARAKRMETGGGRGKKIKGTEEWYEVVLYLGIIDTFQSYGVRKRIEHCYKSIQHDSKSISAVHPKVYSSRFLDFVSQIFLPDDDPSSLSSS
ncbi:PREDICTED: phosphatidylinositol 4-phosphate 5-kinase 10-like [Tarenaya hassleriana]|uniref:phosphatidylinositol 4-phosphate 5-kinase 10-like n=1 Tax=Tarenaya hassleriana TaxID=28532 RepID=UPI00053C8CD1|nr:PREDICTED: phosphatidylinositol 4-phosphate 5-kinase 10-like [Tarenaya hassleriana]XP_010522931.1 PREDICTED: phosphatidylinositol 4-phosphate 5-kinase 10-like [Tarenaya hassleriana]